MKKFLSILLAAFMVFALVGCSSSKIETIKKDENKAEGEFAGKTVVLHTNDMHGGFIVDPDAENTEDGGLEGYAAVTSVKKDFEAKGATVILVDDGDFSQGSIYVSLSKGAIATQLMDLAGYDLVGLGNHEFDYGVDALKNNFVDKNFKVICANIFEGENTLFDAHQIFQIGKLKVAFFGLDTPETQTKVNPNYVKDLKFTEGQELFDTAQKEIDLLKEEADIVICVAHLGVDAESAGRTSEDLFANTTGLDFIIDGHSHTVMENGSNGEPIQSTGTKGQNIGVIVIDNANKTIESNYLLPLKDVEADIEVLDVAMKYMLDVDTEFGSIFANSDLDLCGEKAIVRSQETNMGNLIADAMCWEVLKAGSIDVAEENVVAVTNGGGIRASISAGGVSMKDINTVLPFGNTVAVDYCTGAELLEVLEASTYAVPETLGGFPQVSGIEFTIDSTVEFDAGEEYPDSTYFKPNSIKRVTIQSINGQPFDENATYAVVTNNFCAAGGDTYYALKKAYDAGNGFDTGIPLDEAVVDYINNKLGGKIGSEYAETQGRITIVQ